MFQMNELYANMLGGFMYAFAPGIIYLITPLLQSYNLRCGGKEGNLAACWIKGSLAVLTQA